MTTITLPRAVVEQALEALEKTMHAWGGTCAWHRDVKQAIDALRAALAQQAEPVQEPEPGRYHGWVLREVLFDNGEPVGHREPQHSPAALAQEQAEPAQEPHRDLRAALQAPGCERLREWVEIGPVQRAALETFVAALAQEQKQAEQTWVCPDSPEHRYAKPGHCEDCGKTLVLAQEQGCDHCNHPLYAATKCRVCGRVTEPKAEPTYKTYPIRMKFEWVGDRWLFDDNPIDNGEWCVTLGDGGWMIYPKVEQTEPVQEPVAVVRWNDIGHISWRTHVMLPDDTPLYTAPPMTEPVQEPVAWMYTGIKQDGTEHGPHLVWKPEYMDAMSASKGAKATPLYTVADLLRAQQAAPVQEPVAWMDIDRDGTRLSVRMWSDGNRDEVPLYTAPPQRLPLTEEEIDAMWRKAASEEGFTTAQFVRHFARAIERALEEKNRGR